MWIIEYETESADRGVCGYWEERPDNDTMKKYLTSHFPEDYPDYFYYHFTELRRLD